MATTLISTGYNMLVDFVWSGGYVWISYDGGTNWTSLFSLTTESGLRAVEYYHHTLQAWVWCLILQNSAGQVVRKVSADRGVTWQNN